MVVYYFFETSADPCAQGSRLMAQHISKPVTALAQHVRQQSLDIAPVVIEALEQQLHVFGKLWIFIRSGQRLAGRSVVQLVWPLRDDECSTRLCGYGELGRQPEIERVDGLDS